MYLYTVSWIHIYLVNITDLEIAVERVREVWTAVRTECLAFEIISNFRVKIGNEPHPVGTYIEFKSDDLLSRK
jgi:hypothetical protein